MARCLIVRRQVAAAAATWMVLALCSCSREDGKGEVVDASTDVPPTGDASRDSEGDAGDAFDASTDAPWADGTGNDSEGGAVSDSGVDGPPCDSSCDVGDTRCGPDGGLETCAMVEGCPAWGAESPCIGMRTCGGSAPHASCDCPAAPVGCESGVGSSCSDEKRPRLLTCKARDVDGCLYVEATDCPEHQWCNGIHPQAACRCSPTWQCEQGTQHACLGLELYECRVDEHQCKYTVLQETCPPKDYGCDAFNGWCVHLLLMREEPVQ